MSIDKARFPGVNDLIIEALGFPPPRGAKTALASAVGVSATTITRWVDRYTSPEPDKWAVIEEHLDLAPGALARAAGFDVTTSTSTNGDVRRILADHEHRIRALEELLGSRALRDVSARVDHALAQPPEERMPPPAEIERRTRRARQELGLAAKGDQKAARRGGEEVSRPEPPAEQDDA